MTQSSRPSPPDRPGFWMSMAGISAALGGIGITIAVTEYHPPWSSAWFIAGTVLCGLGCVFAVWALVLYLAHKEAGEHWCPDPQAHVLTAEQLAPGAQSSGPARQPPSAEGVLAAAQASRAELAQWLRPVLRQMNGDLRQAAAAIERAKNENSYLGVRHEFETGHRWEENSERLAGLTGQGDLYDSLRDSYSHIVRMNRIVSATAITPMQSHDLAAAFTAIRNAETVVSRELVELG